MRGVDGCDQGMREGRDGAPARSGVVLVHGGLHGAWCWDRLRPLLDWPSLAVELPGRGMRPAQLADVRLTDLVDAIVDDVLASGFDSIVLVAHSMGGLSAPSAAIRLGGRVQHLVLVSAVVPAEGRCGIQGPAKVFEAWLRRKLGRELEKPDGKLELPQWLARRMFCSDLSKKDAAQHMAQLCPEAPGILLESVSRTGLDPALPRTYVKLTKDKAIPARSQEAMARQIGARVVSMAAGHSVMVSQPAALAAVLNQICAASNHVVDT
jgi:pimeloyl-ACP methyl ester carboxylesterase